MHGKSLIKLYPKQAQLVKTMAKDRRVITLACRQCGKCCSSTTYVRIRCKQTGVEEEITIEEFFNRFKNKLKNTEIYLNFKHDEK